MTIDLAAPTHEAGTGNDVTGGYVLAAVHPDSHRLDAIIARATAQATATDSVVIFLTVANSRPVGHHLTRMATQLARSVHPVHLVATWVDGEHVPRRQRPALIATEIAAAAKRLGAAAVVVGHDPTCEASSASVTTRLLAELAADVTVCLGTDVTLSDDFPLQHSTHDMTHRKLPGVHLTDQGRRQLASRARRIERKELPAARRRLAAQPRSTQMLLAYEALINDYRALTHLVANAPPTAQIPDDPERVELGERVELATEDGVRRRLVVVADVEAVRGRACAAASSATGQALLGRRVGDWTSIPTPRGPRRARILAATR